MEHCTGGGDQNHPKGKERNSRRQRGCLRKLYKQLSKEEKRKAEDKREKYTQLNTDFQREGKYHGEEARLEAVGAHGRGTTV